MPERQDDPISFLKSMMSSILEVKLKISGNTYPDVLNLSITKLTVWMDAIIIIEEKLQRAFAFKRITVNDAHNKVGAPNLFRGIEVISIAVVKISCSDEILEFETPK